jgi:cyclic pyranopterin phosphate synthase
MSPETAAAVAAGDSRKGDVSGRLAWRDPGRQARRADPLAHSVALTFVGVEGRIDATAASWCSRRGEDRRSDRGGDGGDDGLCRCCLTVYDMVKGIERRSLDRRISLLEKSGGRSGEWHRESGAGDEGLRGS